MTKTKRPKIRTEHRVTYLTQEEIQDVFKNIKENAGTKLLNRDLALVMLRMIRKADVTGLETGLQDLAQSLPTPEVKMFCTVLQQSLNFGSSIYSHLIQLSADLREMQLLVIEEKLGTLSAKMSIPLIIFIMVPIIILIVAPGVMRVFPSVL